MVTPVYQCDECKAVFKDKNIADKHNRVCTIHRKVYNIVSNESTPSLMRRYVDSITSSADVSDTRKRIIERRDLLVDFVKEMESCLK